MLEDAVQAAQQLDLTGANDFQAARLITGHELDEENWAPLFERANQIVFVPSAHVGPYLGQFCERDTVRVLYGARLPEGVTFSAPDLSRAEILVRLNALADGNRLRILKLISERGEHLTRGDRAPATEPVDLLAPSQSAKRDRLSRGTALQRRQMLST
jgi:hypothetical protein